MATTRSKSTADSYFELVQKFPLRPIKSESEHDTATDVIGDLLGRRLDSGAGDYLDTLLMLVTRYEDEHHDLGPDLSPRELLRALMRANDLSQADIGDLLGSESAVSMFLNGKRDLSKSQIKTLASRFKVDAGAFL